MLLWYSIIMITKKTWSTESNDWVEVNIDPKIKLTAHPDGDKMIIDITKISPNPANEHFYSNEEIEDSAKELAYGVEGDGSNDLCMLHRLKAGTIVNHEAIKICPMTGKIWSGHTRYRAAIMVGAKFVYVVFADEIYSNDIPERKNLDKLHSYNLYKRPEQTIKQQTNKAKKLVEIICNDLNNSKEEEGKLNDDGSNIVIPSFWEIPHYWNKYFKKEMMKLQESFLNKKLKNASYIRNIIKLSFSPNCHDIVSRIDDGELALNAAMKDLRGSVKKPYITNPNTFNFGKFFDNNKEEFIDLYKDYFRQAHNWQFNQHIIKTRNGNIINVETDKKHTREKPKKTAILSDETMSITSIVYNELGLNATTAGGMATNSADVQFPDITAEERKINSDYPLVEIEVKNATIKNDDAIFYGGPDMKKHKKYYMFKVFNDNHTKCFSFQTFVDGPVIAKTGKGKDSCTMNLKDIVSHHKNDIRMIYGSKDENNKFTFENILTIH